jgi:uncharacterized protein (DUF433 family)
MATLSLTTIDSPLRVDESGTVRIGRTRVTLDTLIASYNDGDTAEEIVAQFPSLALADVHAAISYYLIHTDEVDTYLRQREEEAVELRNKAQASSDQRGIRQRLLARQNARKTGT